MDFENFGAAETAGLVLTGMVVVFIALIILIFLIWAFGKIMSSRNGSSGNKQQSAAAPVPPAPKAASVPSVAAAVSDGLSDEVVAAIMGAVSAILAEEGDGKSYVVRSIKRGRRNRGAWGKAGVEENTRPF